MEDTCPEPLACDVVPVRFVLANVPSEGIIGFVWEGGVGSEWGRNGLENATFSFVFYNTFLKLYMHAFATHHVTPCCVEFALFWKAERGRNLVGMGWRRLGLHSFLNEHVHTRVFNTQCHTMLGRICI